MTRVAMHRRSAIAVGTAPHVHDVPVKIVTLARVVTTGVAHETTRMPERGRDGLEGSQPCCAARYVSVRRSLRDRIEPDHACRERGNQRLHADHASTCLASLNAASTRAGVNGRWRS